MSHIKNIRKKTIIVILTVVATHFTVTAEDLLDKQLYCEALANAFHTEILKVTEIEADRLETTKRLASDGESECRINPELGALKIKAALFDIGISGSTVDLTFRRRK